MFNLKMVDTAGGGIRKMFNYQKERYFPMPDYDLNNGKVKMTLIGKILDMNYARVLAQNTDLGLEEIMLLDKVQKKQPLTIDAERHLKSKKLIEGRKPNYFIGKQMAQQLNQKAAYTKNKAFDKQYYMDLILQSITQHGSMTRKDIDELLWKKLPEWMTNEQRKYKIGNLLSELRILNKIKNTASLKNPIWKLF
jgi:ATP-dependent DNA helicase RecG